MNQQLISTLLAYLLPVVAALCAYGYQLLAQRLPAQQRNALDQFATVAVQKVEQQYGSSAPGDKKQLAEQIIAELFRAFGLPLPQQAAIDAAIESAVFAMSQAQAQAPTQPISTDQARNPS